MCILYTCSEYDGRTCLRFYCGKKTITTCMSIKMYLKRMFLNYVPPVVVSTAAYEQVRLYYSNDFETHLARRILQIDACCDTGYRLYNLQYLQPLKIIKYTIQTRGHRAMTCTINAYNIQSSGYWNKNKIYYFCIIHITQVPTYNI